MQLLSSYHQQSHFLVYLSARAACCFMLQTSGFTFESSVTMTYDFVLARPSMVSEYVLLQGFEQTVVWISCTFQWYQTLVSSHLIYIMKN